MAKPMPNKEHHSNCNCCGKQASFIQSARKPSGFGPLQSIPSPRKSTVHTTSKSPERASSGFDIKKSLQYGNESNLETSLEDTFNKLVSGDYTSTDLATEIVEEVANQVVLQAKESRMKGTSRDKESLLEECSNLNNASIDQLYHLKLHKVHHESIYLEQRRIESAIEELEMANGLEAPRTGGQSKLKSKILGLKCRQQEYFFLLTTLGEDLKILRRDPQVSLTNEADVERDIFASEIRRLQKMVQQLRKFYHKLCAENNEVHSLREDITKFSLKLTNVQISLKDKKTLLNQMQMDTDKAKFDAIEARKLARNANYKAGELESHSVILRDMLTSEKEEGQNLHKQMSTLSEQTRNIKKENSDRETAAKIAAMTAATGAEAADFAAKGAGKGAKMGKLKGSPYGSDAEDSASMGFDGMDSGGRDGTNSANSKGGRGGKEGDSDGSNSANSRGGRRGKGGDSDGSNSANSKGGRGEKGRKLGRGKDGDKILDTNGAGDSDDGRGGKGRKLGRGKDGDKILDTDGAGDSNGSNSANSRGGRGGKGGKLGRGKDGDKTLGVDGAGDSDGSNSANSKGGRGGKGGKLGQGKDDDKTLGIDGEGEAYLREIGLAPTKFLESAPTSKSGSPKGKSGSPTSPTDGDHSEYKFVRDAFQQNTSDSEERFLSADELQYGGGPRPDSQSRNAREAQLAAESEALKKASSPQTSVQNLPIQLDDQVLLPNEYVVDVQDSRTNVRNTSPDKIPEALLVKKKAEEEARKQKEVEEVRRRAQEEEERKKKATREKEEVKKKAVEDSASKAASLELDAKKKKKDAAKLKSQDEATKAKASGSGKLEGEEFFDDKMQGIIKQNVQEVLSHLETISKSVQQKATASGTAKSTAKDVLNKLEKP